MSAVKNNKPKYNPWMMYLGIILMIFGFNYLFNGGGFGET